MNNNSTVSVTQLRLRALAPIGDFHNLGEYVACGKNGYTFIDKGADILGVAHLDTVLPKVRHFNVAKGKVYTPQLDDRLGAFTLLDVLPGLGVHFDVLLCEDEESMNSSAMHFKAPRQYKWIFELDRAGHDVVLYQYEDTGSIKMCEEAGWKVGIGSYSDICELESLGVKAFNFGIGYHGQHTNKCYMDIEEWGYNVRRFVDFYNQHKDVQTEHEEQPLYWSGRWAWDNDDYLYQGSYPPSLYKNSKNSKHIYGYRADDYCDICQIYYVDDDNCNSIYKTGCCVRCAKTLGEHASYRCSMCDTKYYDERNINSVWETGFCHECAKMLNEMAGGSAEEQARYRRLMGG